MIQNSHKHLKDYHLTTSRATYFVDRIKRAFNKWQWLVCMGNEKLKVIMESMK